ncbi:hypothetical protein CcaverHIS002_0609140 [Cutaneotrichosporon cavernicola]|uniref:Nab2 type CCCH zinc finger 4 domain-containing protein n=1 Tax=Cutaneotrichosporon cavernicola TaxID=279322 RepID=A0AA48L915_9TREE|nr:uncharacterized protein CcaverHIS019_0608600 [Cutaneotrichosporon cavernicola]BEI86627.1 hypothetical protein CcaverHIS002_0609140 [Cutaneotrichosporon cavernicola]BEI94401.1 hypothetical protein CcaverHIS019_0608600 [Cutaneotrichosporon cavernicola]BEJ02178.1 hypothetical protein CcaverHIS631_0608600 [Cutaneotrichosporon cavernicola]BEJ09939.1 hypothetical protein CcaverHIS641_0608540 [Cutaneotrichosporon cavernicola]
MSSEQLNQKVQEAVQVELENREYAEAGDPVMAEYVMVLLNGKEPDPVEHMKKELGELVGPDFTSDFVDWVFQRRYEIQSELDAAAAPPPPQQEARPAAESAPSGPSRMFASAVEGTKRKAEPELQEPSTRRRLPDGPLGAPTGPRSMRDRELLPDRPDRRDDRNGGAGRSLMDRLGPHGQRGPMSMRGGMDGRGPMNGGPMGPRGPGFQRGFNQGMMPPGAPEAMMMQMMAMQANMQQMAQQMAQMNDKNTQRPTRPARGAPTKPPFAAKTSAPAKAAAGAIPDRPLSSALCKFGVGCTNARCTYSHPSPVADEKSGMVLSEEACEAGKDCKDPECIKSHVSPAAVSGASTGPSRVLCKFQHCTNPSCQYRHEDADGNFIPPPALSKKDANVNTGTEDEGRDDEIEVVVKTGLDAPLDNSPQERPCRYAERCTRADCKFTHPASRPTPRGAKPTRGRPRPDGITGGMAGMTPSRKFAAPAAESQLNPTAGEFKPAAEKEVDVSM